MGSTSEPVAKRELGVRVTRPVPAVVPGEPTDEELLGYLDGTMTDAERIRLEARLEDSPLSRARLEILAEALAENR